MNRNHKLLASLLLTISICGAATAQTSPDYSRPSASPAATKAAADLTPDQVVRLLVDKLNEERQIHEATRKERDEAVAALEIEKRNSASLERSYKTAEKEIATLDRALAHQERAIALYEQTISLVEKQRDDAKKEAKRARKIATVSTLVLIGTTAARVFGIF